MPFNVPRKSGVFPGERFVAIITPALLVYPFSFDVWTLKWDCQTADVFCTYRVGHQSLVCAITNGTNLKLLHSAGIVFGQMRVVVIDISNT